MNFRVPIENFITASIDTLYMSFLSFFLAAILAVLLGIFLYLSRNDGIYPKPVTYSIVSGIINFLRSTPFVILMLLLVPLTRLIVGTSIGTNAVIVSLVIFGMPFMSRLVESAFLEIDTGVIELARSLGASTFALITKFMLPEAASTLTINLTIGFVSLIGATAIAGTIGGGGLGDLAIQFGYQRYDYLTMGISVGLIVIFVQVIQFIGNMIAKKVKYLSKKY